MPRKSKKSGATIVGDPLDMSALQYSSWKFNHTTGAYFYPESSNNSTATDPIRLWQIRSFPFDPSKRLSSALVLTESADHAYRLWVLTKGSPGTMAQLYAHDDDGDDNSQFIHRFNNHTQGLEAQGYRCIALGAAELSTDSSIVADLFPNGMSGDGEFVEYARAKSAALHRSDFENLRAAEPSETETSGLKFHGYACFDAKVRPSSKRVIQELQRGGIQPVMLTGDAIDAALAVASNVGLIKERKVAILETHGSSIEPMLRWRFVVLKDGKASPSSLQNSEVNMASVRDVVKRQKQGKYAMAATGDALELILDEPSSEKTMKSLADNLFRFSVIARATPALKTLVVTCLKDRCDKTVMMCGKNVLAKIERIVTSCSHILFLLGDGVNDVSAMKAADVAVALLNGFGAEGENGLEQDLDDKRRQQKLKLMKIGSHRRNVGTPATDQKKMGLERVNAKIEEAHAEIRRKAAAKQGSDPENVVLEFQDVKAMMSATMTVVKAENKRKQSLKKGGGDAARILAEERKMQSVAGDNDEEAPKVETIKPGEASLVASFSCLHPSIDGVDAVLRHGIATAACALATQKTIALHSLMACYHLASLYRDGFRYGKKMWPVELTLYILVDQARYGAACKARPRLPASKSLRPSISMFHSSVIGSTVGQAVIHLVTMAVGVDYARRLEMAAKVKKAASIRLNGGNFPMKLELLLGALVQGMGMDEEGVTGIFRRPPFRPNYETNIVFLLSILQSGVSSLVNHQGKPFYRSILETRNGCVLFGSTLVFTVACISESFPDLNNYLQMRMLPSRKSRWMFFGIVAANILGCFGCRILADLSLEKPVKQASVVPSSFGNRTAAEMEETLLEEEERQNMREVLLPLLGISVYLALEGLSKAPAAL
jgi:magnesium-transporting ATPase (P-type)